MPYQKGDGPSVVIALGGNALGNSPQEQLELVKNTAKHIVDMIADGVNVVVSHGNGPQIGMINNAFAYAAANDGKTPEMPFPEAGAMSQGYIGYQLSQAILNDLKARGIDRSVANVITQTVVNPEDPAFQNPTKPVGAFMTEEEAKAKAAETGWTFKEDAGRGWRQVVASPKPERRQSISYSALHEPRRFIWVYTAPQRLLSGRAIFACSTVSSSPCMTRSKSRSPSRTFISSLPAGRIFLIYTPMRTLP